MSAILVQRQYENVIVDILTGRTVLSIGHRLLPMVGAPPKDEFTIQTGSGDDTYVLAKYDTLAGAQTHFKQVYGELLARSIGNHPGGLLALHPRMLD